MIQEQELARKLHDLGCHHADMAEASDNLTIHLHELLAIGEDETGADVPDLESELADIATGRESAAEQHGDYARFFFGMADRFQSSDWRYTDLKLIHEMMET